MFSYILSGRKVKLHMSLAIHLGDYDGQDVAFREGTKGLKYFNRAGAANSEGVATEDSLTIL